MPRVYNEGTEVHEWSEETGNGSSVFDLCNKCYPEVVGFAPEVMGLVLYQPGEPEGVLEGGVEHPDYDDDYYTCTYCGEVLTSSDNDPPEGS